MKSVYFFKLKFKMLLMSLLIFSTGCGRSYSICRYSKDGQNNIYKILDGKLEEIILFESGLCYKLSLGLRLHYGPVLRDSYCIWREIEEGIVLFMYYPTYIGTYLDIDIFKRKGFIRYFWGQVYVNKVSDADSYLGLGYSDTLQKVMERLYCSRKHKSECYVEIY